MPKATQGTEEPGSKTDNGEVVQKPQPKVNQTSTTEKDVDDDDDRLSGNVVINVGGQVQWTTSPPKPPGDLHTTRTSIRCARTG